MEEKIKRLKELLVEHDNNKEIQYTDNSIRYYNTNLRDNDIIKELEDLAIELFVTFDGRPNYAMIAAVKKESLHVFPGDKDSFGWLTGCVKLYGQNHAILVFG